MNRQFFLVVLMLLQVSLLTAQTSESNVLVHGFEDTGAYESFRALITTSDGHVVMAGEWNDGKAVLVKVDWRGKEVWRKNFGPAIGWARFLDLTELPNGNIAAVGHCSGCWTSDTLSRAFVVETDADGNELQRAVKGDSSYRNYAHAVVALPGGNFAMAGSARGVHRGQLYILDSSLNTLDSMLLLSSGYNQEFAFDLELLADSELVSIGWALSGTGSGMPMHRFDLSGNLLSSQVYFPQTGTANAIGHAVAQLASGDLVITGGVDAGAGRLQDVLLARIDSVTGAVLQDTTFGGAGNDKGLSLRTIGNRILLGGQIVRYPIDGYSYVGLSCLLEANFEVLDTADLVKFGTFNRVGGLVPMSKDGRDFAVAGWGLNPGPMLRDALWMRRTSKGRFAQMEEWPQNLRLFPRDLQANLADVDLSGWIVDTGQHYDSLRLYFFQEDTLLQDLKIPLSFSNDSAAFSFSIQIPAVLKNHRVALYGVANGDLFKEAEAWGLLAGDAYIITGQSNSVSQRRGGSAIADASRFARVYGSGNPDGGSSSWYKAGADVGPDRFGNLGQFGTSLANQIITDLQIPVAFLNGGANGKLISYFLPVDNAPLINNNYGRLLLRAQQSELQSAIRGVIFWQGESNAFNPWTVAAYESDFRTLYREWRMDYQAVEKIYLMQIREGCSSDIVSGRVMQHQLNLADALPDTRIMSTTGLDHLFDQCHYNYAQGYEKAGIDVYGMLKRDLYKGMDSLNITPPRVQMAWFPDCHRDTICLLLADSLDSYSMPAAAANEFLLNQIPDSVQSGYLSGNIVTLVLSDTLPDSSLLSFRGHVGPAAPYLQNAKGIGLLGFDDLLVTCAASPPPVNAPTEEAPTRKRAVLQPQIVPNPVSRNGEFQLNLPDEEEVLKLTCFNELGQQVPLERNGETLRWRSPGRSGLYFLRVYSPNGEVWATRLLVLDRN